jgi:broad specificity phosphatase PhoE
LGERLNAMRFAKVFTSPLQRALRTCELAGLADVAEIDPDLMEWDYGEYEGLKTPEVLVIRPAWELFRDGCPGGESPQDVLERVHRVLHRVHTAPGDVLLFGSGHFLRMLATRWIGAEPVIGKTLLLGAGSLSSLGYDNNVVEAFIGQGSIHFWNDTHHVLSPDAHKACEHSSEIRG